MLIDQKQNTLNSSLKGIGEGNNITLLQTLPKLKKSRWRWSLSKKLIALAVVADLGILRVLARPLIK